MILKLALLLLVTASSLAGLLADDCSDAHAPAQHAAVPAAPRASVAATSSDPVLLAAGDIASCSSTGDEATATLLDGLTGTVATLGDNAYDNGSGADFTNCYGPTWGRHLARTMPAAGNHDYNTAGASAYYAYFGPAAGDPARGYYSYDLGDWHLVVINSNCAAIGGCGPGSPQEQWLRADLAAHPADCTLAYWHHPRFSSGSSHGDNAAMQPIWQALYDYRAEIVLSGHEHNYERFAPQTPSGAADATFGIREFVVGTGGRSHYGFGAAKPNSEVRDSATYGVLELTLHPSGYDWQFVPVTGSSFTDSGTGSCQPGNSVDADLDGIADVTDNCPGIANADQANNDRNFIDLPGAKPFDDTTRAMSDALGDACDPDDDNDGLTDADEVAGAGCGAFTAPTDPFSADSDGDRALDGAECARASNPLDAGAAPSQPSCGAAADADGDGVLDYRESCYYGTSASSVNSDNDGCGDAREIASINADLQVNVIDLQQVALSVAGTYIADFDTSKNGTIDVIDLGFVAARAGICP